MSLIFESIDKIIDTRCPENKLLSGEITLAYTLETDDITKGKKPSCTPFQDREDSFLMIGERMVSRDTTTLLEVQQYEDGLILELTGIRPDFSEFGVNLPINFMGKRGLGGWENQFLFNSPYRSPDKKFIYTYLAKPNGNNIVIAILSEADGWKMDYSPYSWGHYFISLKLLANYDRAYGTKRKNNHIKIAVLPVSDFGDCLEKLSRLYGVPFMDYEVSGGALGDGVRLLPYGEVDSIIESHGGVDCVLPFEGEYRLRWQGETELTPVCRGKRGAPVTVYGYDSLTSLYKKSMDSVDTDIIKRYTDSNLCEHQCWAAAMLRYLQKYGNTLSCVDKTAYEAKIKALLDVITEQDESKATHRITILNKPHGRYPAYNVYNSCRVQELHFGIIILSDAYKYTRDEKYYEYAVGATDCLLSFYYRNGAIEVDWGDGHREDYTTVCSPMIALCTMVELMQGRDEKRYLAYRQAACQMAEHLYKRGLKFPTEGSGNDVTEEEMEDGSISCTALSLLYYCKHIERDEGLLEKAKEILDLHDCWVMKPPVCQMHYSTLRWWETGWEGDGDGPALCCGHGWTIWRAEADYLYYDLTGDEEHLRRAKNGFLTNISKIREDGTTYAIYNTDELNGGGFHCETERISYKLANRFASVPDCGLSRYLWVRINEALLQ